MGSPNAGQDTQFSPSRRIQFFGCLPRCKTGCKTRHPTFGSLAVLSLAIKRKTEKYLKPALLVIDELGYLPIDKFGADCLFQIISGRYERSSTIITSNRAFKHWAEIFNNDSTLTSALLDRLLHHTETILIEGRSYRMKDQIENPKG